MKVGLPKLDYLCGCIGKLLFRGKEMTIHLGRLKKVDLREFFKDEAKDFTPWLAEENNLELLGETLGLDIESNCL